MADKIIVPRDPRNPNALLAFFNNLANRTQTFTNEGYYQPISSSDSDAPNNSVYFSTDQSKLVYKDENGIVNDLY